MFFPFSLRTIKSQNTQNGKNIVGKTVTWGKFEKQNHKKSVPFVNQMQPGKTTHAQNVATMTKVLVSVSFWFCVNLDQIDSGGDHECGQ